MVKKAIIPAAGYGTRSLPITKSVPKEMFPIGAKPAIQFMVEEAMEAGIEEILIILSRQKDMIVDYFDRSIELETYLKENDKSHMIKDLASPNVRIQYMRQPYATGLGDAVLLGKHFVGDEAFAVLLPDDIILNNGKSGLSQLIEASDGSKNSVVGLRVVEDQYLNKYGVVGAKKMNNQIVELTDMVEKPKSNPPSNMAVIGRYLFQPKLFSYLEKVKPGAGGEIQLTDAIKMLIKDNGERCLGKIIEGNRFDIGSTKEYLELNKYLYEHGLF